MEKSSKELDKRILQIAKKITDLRKKTTETSAENFSNAHNINRVQYWKMEKGTNFTMTSLLKILDIHKLSMSDFFKDIDKY
jgi:hypothetical protein